MTLDYDSISRSYDDVRPAHLEILGSIKSEVSLDRTSQVLDLGCGTGNYAVLLKETTGCCVYGVDPSAGMLEVARGKGGDVKFIQGSSESIPVGESFFDLVYLVEVVAFKADESLTPVGWLKDRYFSLGKAAG